jgi:hypothetical protein
VGRGRQAERLVDQTVMAAMTSDGGACVESMSV